MGVERPVFPSDEKLGCCGHARKLHVPRCEYWFPGMRDEPPHRCGCAGEPAPSEALDGPEASA